MTALRTYRDDGPVSMLVGRTFGRVVPLDGLPLTLLGGLVVAAVLAAAEAPLAGEAAVTAAAFVLLAGARSGDDEAGALAWLVPPLLRAVEYSFLVALTARVEPDAMPLCFAFVTVVALHHYDAVYRLRHQHAAPPAWIGLVGGGWDGRLLLASLFALAGILEWALLVASVALALVYTAESAASWLRYGRQRHAPDEEQVHVEGMLAE